MTVAIQFQVHLSVPHSIIVIQDLLSSMNCEISGDDLSSQIIVSTSSYDEMRLLIDQIIVTLGDL